MATKAPAMGNREKPSDKLTPKDWLEAGQRLLKTEGLKGLKLHPLAKELNSSTGSFYHHFGSFEDYQAALASYFAGDQIAPMLANPKIAVLPPVERVRELVAFTLHNDMIRLGIAMRAWAASDGKALDAVRRHDAAILRFLVNCLLELGFDAREASVRAHALKAVGDALIERPLIPVDELIEGFIRLMCLTPSINLPTATGLSDAA